jgi:hypothetical protein
MASSVGGKDHSELPVWHPSGTPALRATLDPSLLRQPRGRAIADFGDGLKDQAAALWD